MPPLAKSPKTDSRPLELIVIDSDRSKRQPMDQKIQLSAAAIPEARLHDDGSFEHRGHGHQEILILSYRTFIVLRARFIEQN